MSRTSTGSIRLCPAQPSAYSFADNDCIEVRGDDHLVTVGPRSDGDLWTRRRRGRPRSTRATAIKQRPSREHRNVTQHPQQHTRQSVREQVLEVHIDQGKMHRKGKRKIFSVPEVPDNKDGFALDAGGSHAPVPRNPQEKITDYEAVDSPPASPSSQAATNTIANDGPTPDNRVSVCSTRQCQPSSSHALSARLTHRPVPREPKPLAAFPRHELAGYTHPATFSQPSIAPSKRPTLSSHRSNNSRFSDQSGSCDTQADLINNNGGCTNTHIVDMSCESYFSQEDRWHAGSPSLSSENGELSAIAAIQQQSMHFDVSAKELQAKILHQLALNAANENMIAKAVTDSEKASKMLGSYSRQLIEAKTVIEQLVVAQENLRYTLDYTKNDTTQHRADDLKKIVDAFKDTKHQKEMEVAHVEVKLAYLQDEWRRSENNRATAIDHHDQGVKTTVAMVAQLKIAFYKKKHWDFVATAAQMRPERLQQVMGSQFVAAGGLRRAQVDLTPDEKGTVLESLKHALDRLGNEDATNGNADGQKAIVSAYKNFTHQERVEVPEIVNSLVSMAECEQDYQAAGVLMSMATQG